MQQALLNQQEENTDQSDDINIQALPALIIHAFCENNNTASTIHGLSKDRRFKNISMSVYIGGLLASLEFYKKEKIPNLIMIETSLPTQQILELLAQLAEYCTEQTKVIVIGKTNDISLYRKLIKIGISEYLVSPLSAVSFINCIGSLYVNPDEQSVGKVISFFSSCGGSGSSTISQNVGWAISERTDLKCTIIDMDISWGTSGLNFNKPPQSSVLDALIEYERVDKVMLERLMTPFSKNLLLLLAPAQIKETEPIKKAAYKNIIHTSRYLSPYIILDIPHLWSKWSSEILIESNDIYIVSTPDIKSLRNTKNMLDFLKEKRMNDTKAKIILNQVGIPKKPEIPVKEFMNALGTQVEYILPFDSNTVGVAENNADILYNIAPRSKLVSGIEEIAMNITGKSISSQKGEGGLSILNKFLKRS